MIRITTVEAAEPTSEQREQFKAYASIPGEHRDAMLQGCLKRAMLEVQAYSNTALLPCKFTMDVQDVTHGERFELYRGGDPTTVEITADGDNARYHVSGSAVIIDQDADTVTVTYQNKVHTAEVERLQPVIWQYAVALYDGEDPTTLARILKSIYY